MDPVWLRWLHAWCWMALGLSVMFLVCIIPALSAPARLFFDVMFWPIDGRPTLSTPDALLATSLLGAILIGWLILMLLIVRDPVLSQEPKLWRYMTIGLVVWCVIDSVASILAGASLNAVSNAVLTAGWVVPVFASGILTAPQRGLVAR
jgi:hypothetical protein